MAVLQERDRESQNVTTTTRERESYEVFNWHSRGVNSSEHMEYKQRTGHSFGGKSGPWFPRSASLILTDIWTTSILPRTVPGKCNQTNQLFCSSFPTLSFLRCVGNLRQSLLEPFYAYYFLKNQQVDRVQRLRQIPGLSICVPPLVSLGPTQAQEG